MEIVVGPHWIIACDGITDEIAYSSGKGQLFPCLERHLTQPRAEGDAVPGGIMSIVSTSKDKNWFARFEKEDTDAETG